MANEINGAGNQYPQSYLDEIKNQAFSRMDSKDNGGNGDGRVSTAEALNDLHIGGLLSGLQEGSAEYTKLKNLTDKIPNVLAKYAGNDGEFSAQEWAEFLNGNEWGEVLDTYHSSSNFSKIEMGWVDKSQNCFADGKCTKGEVKVGILNNMARIAPDVDCSHIEEIIDKYAGEDGTFTVAEYTAMKNDPEYKAFLKQYHVTPFEFGL